MIGGVLLALAFGTWWIVRRGLRPLDRIGATAGAIAAGDLSQRVEQADPATEVGRLRVSLNAMLERLEEALRDRGPGLPVKDGSELFERFWRAQPARGRGPAGAGLGWRSCTRS